jgi:large subunit ribosomal protein L9
VDVDKSEVRLPEGVIRDVGEYDIMLQLHADVTVNVDVAVVAE